MPDTPVPPPQRKLSFYRRLSPALKREYDRSDSFRRIPLSPSVALGAAATTLVTAIESGGRTQAATAANQLTALLCRAMETEHRGRVPVPTVKVLRVRPSSAGGEFHGLYTRSEDGRSEIKVWMFTAREKRVVRPRTFLRTLLHEVVHHFDIVVFDLPSSLHTLGFHARESSLLAILEKSGARVPGGRKPPPRPVVPKAAPVRRGQLDLF